MLVGTTKLNIYHEETGVSLNNYGGQVRILKYLRRPSAQLFEIKDALLRIMQGGKVHPGTHRTNQTSQSIRTKVGRRAWDG